ncbi:hypothetical protein LFM09_46765 [Lentzea alba]|uniref:hypothetical protein n=1 Tax=Lentzea alba TaxID=2714351 RepID=UPI0039BFAC7B
MTFEPQVDPEEDPVLARAVAATLRDDWRPAADAMAAARDSDRRDHVTEVLARAAVRRNEWLANWRKARPGDRDAAAVLMAMRASS